MKFTASVLSIGAINPKIGKTKYDWNVFDHMPISSLYLCNDHRFLYSSTGSFEIGDEIELRDNDSNRKLNTLTVKGECNSQENLFKLLISLGYNMSTPKPFQKSTGMKFQPKESYSVKGYMKS